jgi:cold-inducible RNA-binding protein
MFPDCFSRGEAGLGYQALDAGAEFGACEMGSKKLFVGGLAWETSDASLSDAFRQYGEVVEAKVITDRDTGRSRGFGFVTFEDEGAAASALQAMNGRDLDGRTLRVDMASEQSRGGGGRSGGRDGGGRRDRW